MPRKIKEPELRQANLSSSEMQEAIPKIDRRLKDLDDFDINSVSERSDPRIDALSNKIETLLANIFGADTVEYKRYHWQATRLDLAPVYMGRKLPIEEVRVGLQKGIANAKEQLESIKSGFLEDLEDAGQTSSGKTLKAYEGLELHPAIEKAAGKLFKDGHYSNAIEDAVKALNALVKLNSGIEDKDGTALMEFVFSPNNPVLKFNNLTDQFDKDEQKKFMMLFSGAVAGLRNPRAHKIINDDAEKAVEFIAFISLLAKLTDKTSK